MLNSRSQPEGPLNWTTSSLAAPEEASLFHNITDSSSLSVGSSVQKEPTVNQNQVDRGYHYNKLHANI